MQAARPSSIRNHRRIDGPRTLAVAVLAAALALPAGLAAQQPAADPGGPAGDAALSQGPQEEPGALPPVSLEVPRPVLAGIAFTATARPQRADQPLDQAVAALLRLRAGDREWAGRRGAGGTVVFEDVRVRRGVVTLELVAQRPDAAAPVLDAVETRAIAGWLSVLPPLLAIAMALISKSVIPALFFGLWVGAWLAVGFGPTAMLVGVLDTFQVYVLHALADPDHAAIILFSLMIGGMVGIVSRNGGMQGVVNIIIRWARTARKGQVATGVLGCVIFFDDYANTLIVGNTMRQVTDRLRVSREKLAYVVDSTAAPVACLALVTTWIGYEVGLIGTAVAGIPGYDEAPYSIFLNSLPYSFYPLLAIFFVFTVAHTGRDFGPMLAAEVRARTTGKVLGDDASVDEAAAGGEELEPKPGKPERAVNALLPVGVLVVSVLAGLYVTGSGETLRDIVGSSDSYAALMWGSLLGVLVAVALSLGQRILSVEETVSAWYAGMRSMMLAMIILVLAWALSAITDVLHTADYLISVLGETLPPGVVPALVFVLSAATAFATGSSWGTMGILMPLVVPLVWAVLQVNAMADPAHLHILYSTVACVLAGSVWGDHCSPISDTTILSSMASGCDHIEHVRTQLPYAMAVGGTALLLGTLPTGFGFSWWLSLPLGVAVLWLVSRYYGKPVDVVVAERLTD